MKKLILAAALLAPLAGSAMAQDAGNNFYGTPEREITNQAPRGGLLRSIGQHHNRPDVVSDEAGRTIVQGFDSNH